MPQVAREFPELGAKYGPSVTYAQNTKAHIRTEFGFDVVQVAKQRYTSDSYHDFIGFEVCQACTRTCLHQDLRHQIERCLSVISIFPSAPFAGQ